MGDLKHYGNYKLLAGVDEVGVGAIAGPVVCAAVILPPDFTSPLIKDSKLLKEKQLIEAYSLIEKNVISISVLPASAKEVNSSSVHDVTKKLLAEAVKKLSVQPEHVLIDGLDKPIGLKLPFTCLPGADNTFLCVAAASIVAKVRRDDYMRRIHDLHPNYDWFNNKGYGTYKHRVGLKEHGITQYHRTKYVKSFLK